MFQLLAEGTNAARLQWQASSPTSPLASLLSCCREGVEASTAGMHTGTGATAPGQGGSWFDVQVGQDPDAHLSTGSTFRLPGFVILQSWACCRGIVCIMPGLQHELSQACMHVRLRWRGMGDQQEARKATLLSKLQCAHLCGLQGLVHHWERLQDSQKALYAQMGALVR